MSSNNSNETKIIKPEGNTNSSENIKQDVKNSTAKKASGDIRKKHSSKSITEQWEKENQKNDPKVDRSWHRKQKLIKSSLLAGLLLVLFAAGYIISFLIANKDENKESLSLDFTASEQVSANSVFDWNLEISNNEGVEFRGVKIELDYDKNSLEIIESSLSNESREDGVGLWSFETLSSKSKKNIHFKVRSIGPEGSESKISIKVTYKLHNSKDEFYKYENRTVKISKPLIISDINSIKETYSDGEKIRLSINIENKDINKFSNLSARVYLPEEFNLSETETTGEFVYLNNEKISSEEASTNDEKSYVEWKIENLQQGELRSLELVGTISGENQSDRVFDLKVGNFLDNEKIYSESSKTVKIVRSIIKTDLTVNHSADQVNANPGGKLEFNFMVTNEGDENTQTLTLFIDFPKYVNLSTLIAPQAEGLEGRTLSFTSRGVPSLSSLAPGESAEVNFEANLTSQIPVSGSEIENDISFDLSSYVKEGFSTGSEKIDSNSVNVKLSSDLQLFGNKAYYFVPENNLEWPKNSGPIPPAANKETTYIIYWQLKNGSNKVENTEIIAQLPSDVVFKNISDTTHGSLGYDPISRKITWSVGNLDHFEGSEFSEEVIYAWFQIGVYPTLSDIGYTMPILNQPVLTYIDSFNSEEISKTYDGKDSSIPEDIQAKIKNQGGIVQEFSSEPDPIIDDGEEIDDENSNL